MEALLLIHLKASVPQVVEDRLGHVHLELSVLVGDERHLCPEGLGCLFLVQLGVVDELHVPSNYS